MDLLLERIPAPVDEPGHPLQAHVTNLDASPYVGRLALCRVRNGTIRRGQAIAWCRADGSDRRAPGRRALHHRGARPRRGRRGRARGDHRRAPGSPRSTIGETLADPDDPRAAAGHHGRRALAVGRRSASTPPPWPARTARSSPRARSSDASTPSSCGNVSLRVSETERPDAWEVQGRGELAARGARRDHAPRGLRADRRPAAGRHARDRRQDGRAGRAPRHRRPRGLRRRGHPAAGAAQGRSSSRWSTTARAGCAWSTSCPPAA